MLFKTAAIDHSATHPNFLLYNDLRHDAQHRSHSAFNLKDT